MVARYVGRGGSRPHLIILSLSMNNNGSEISNWTNTSSENTLEKKLIKFLDSIKMYNGISEFINNKTKKEVKEYWDIVELCRDIKKKMESIYEKP